MTLVADVAAKLVSSLLATALGTDLFAYRFPSSPLNAICIVPMALKPPDPLLSNSLDYPAVQIQVRNTSVVLAESSAETIRMTLDNSTISGYIYCKTTRSRPTELTNPDDLAVTGGPCYRFSVDFELMKVR